MTTALGPVRLSRDHLAGTGFAADGVLGLEGFLTRQATRLVSLLAVEHSFGRSQRMLSELCGWEVDDETIRRATHAEAKRASATRGGRSDAARFAAAPGAAEVLADAGKVNTRDGWRDVKVGVLLCREAGPACTPDNWEQRNLPRPTARTVVAGIEEAGQFGVRLRAEADRLGITTASDVSALGDGAEWIWKLVEEHLPQASQTLDVFHAFGHIAEAAKDVWGDAAVAKGLADAGRAALLSGGKAGLDRWLGEAFRQAPDPTRADPLVKLAAYFAKHPTRLDYAGRLAGGRSIGSGAVEGAIKQQVNLRLKRTGARWRPEHVGPLVELRALALTPEWTELWAAA